MTGGFIYDNWSPSRGEERSGSRNEGKRHQDVMTHLFCHNSAPNTPFRTRRNRSPVSLVDHSPKYLSLNLRSSSLIPSPLTKGCDTHYPPSLSPSFVASGFPLKFECMKHLRTATGLTHIQYQVVGRSIQAG